MEATRLLDLTRSLRRAGRVATGVDRVERAYLDQFLSDSTPCFALMRTAFGYVLLDRDGMRAFADRLDGAPGWANADLMSRLPRRRSEAVKKAETEVRRRALARSLPSRLRKMLGRHLPKEFGYYNVGHSNLTERVLGSVKYAGGRIHIFIHDVIPLEYPDFQKPGTIRPFREKLQRVRKLADRIIFNSADTQRRTTTLMQDWGDMPASIVAHLGTIAPLPDPDVVPPELKFSRPYFVIVGTIEPRKNHAFLLDLWAEMGTDAPPLLICGSRGWNNEAVFAQLDALPPQSPIREVAGLNDAAIASLVQGSAGALFPSLAEGFGLPPVEALQLGTRVLCNDLIVMREILSDWATFAPVSDREKWLRTIRRWENTPPHADNAKRFVGPNWPDHFKTVLRLK